uniref:Uncharacterized protein n=1 Tax=Noccaea caerulescens TaxID=107243 RepID=A0A1J3CKG7_NOCCA
MVTTNVSELSVLESVEFDGEDVVLWFVVVGFVEDSEVSTARSAGVIGGWDNDEGETLTGVGFGARSDGESERGFERVRSRVV